MGRKLGTKAVNKRDPAFTRAVLDTMRLDPKTGSLRFEGMYVSAHLDIGWKGSVVSVPVSHVVWLAAHGRWPAEGLHLDHLDNDPLNNKLANLAEVTHTENQRRRRGRTVSHAYGTGKYGHGISVNMDKRDGRFYVSRQMSRGHGNGDLKNVRVSLGGFATLAAAESKVRRVIRRLDH
jgi:hypothetical protein